MKIIERVFDATTGETKDVERDATAQEIAEIEATQTRATALAQAEAETQAKRFAALAKLEALGLDEDDLKALGF